MYTYSATFVRRVVGEIYEFCTNIMKNIITRICRIMSGACYEISLCRRLLFAHGRRRPRIYMIISSFIFLPANSTLSLRIEHV